MASQNEKFLLATGSGAISGLLGLPIIAGVVRLPSFVLVFFPGFIFSVVVLITIAAIYPATRTTNGFFSWLYSSVALALGMPAALAAGAVVLNIADRFFPGTRYQFGGIGISFFIAELAACAIWSAILWLSLFFLCKVRLSSLLLVILSTTLSVMIVMNILCAASVIFLQRSVPLTFTSITEQMASALLLAVGVARSTDAGTKSCAAASP